MDGADAIKPKKGWRFRMSIATVFFLMACIAGYLSGLRLGGDASAIQRRREAITTQVYSVSDLIDPIGSKPGWSATEDDFIPLLELITSTVSSDEWGGSKGSNTSSITPFAANSSIVVTCSGATHDELAGLLQQLRDLQFKLPEDYLKRVREVASRRIPAREIVKSFTTTSPTLHERMQNHFNSAMTELKDEFGEPDLVAAAGDSNFPSWLAAQRTAVWDRRSGKLYFAIIDCRPNGEALVAGWWEQGEDDLGPVVFAANTVD